MKKLISVLLACSFFVACAPSEPPETETSDNTTQTESSDETGTDEVATGDDFKIGIVTGTVAQNEEEDRAGVAVAEKYGDMVIHRTYPDRFMEEQETVISNISSLADDPEVKAIVICQGVPGTSPAIDKIKETRDDILIIVGTPGEDPQMIAERADMVLMADELGMGYSIVEQAQLQGAETLIHYSFPRHMSYALLAERRDIMRSEAEAAGMEFVEITTPDPTGDAGTAGTQQFILEDVPREIEKYGENTAFFGTNCAMQPQLITQVYEYHGIYPQPCCPSPFHGFPSALAIDIPEDKQGDVDYLIDEITEKAAENDMTGRMSTWPVPISMMIIEAGAEYAIDWARNGADADNKVDADKLEEKFVEYMADYGDDLDVQISTLDNADGTYDNYFMILCPYLNF